MSAGSTTTIGRSDDCEVCLRDADASRKHAEIRHTVKGVSIADLGSKNGVRVNDKRIEGPTTLRDGDRIRIGETELRYGDPAEQVLADLQQEGDEVSAQRPSASAARPNDLAPGSRAGPGSCVPQRTRTNPCLRHRRWR